MQLNSELMKYRTRTIGQVAVYFTFPCKLYSFYTNFNSTLILGFYGRQVVQALISFRLGGVLLLRNTYQCIGYESFFSLFSLNWRSF